MYMKMFNKLMTLSLSMLTIAILTGCAAGAATAGYALKAQSADSLTASAEQRIVDRAKSEIMSDLYKQQHVSAPCTQAPILN